MYQGRQAASARATGEYPGSGPPTASTPPPAQRRRLRLAAEPQSVCAAREFTVATLHRWRLDALTEDAVLIASELATNAIQHGTPAATGGDGDRETGQVELSWCLQASRLTCVVTDQTGRSPALAAGGPDAESGHGLQIVAALTAAWGWTILPSGDKAVWATLELPAPRRRRTGHHGGPG